MPSTLYPGQLELPFLDQPGLGIHHSDPQLWAELVSSTIPVSICEPRDAHRPFHNRTAVVNLGAVTAVATEGSAISVSTEAHQACQLLLPYNGNGFWSCEGRTYDNPVGCSVLFLPPASLRLENTVTCGVSLNIAADQLIRTAVTMAGPDGIGRDLAQALLQPQRLLWHQAGQRELVACVYRTLTSADQALQAGPGALPMLRLDDLLIRLTVLLLLPELRQLATGRSERHSSQPSPGQLGDLLAWIEAHLDQPISLSDLETQARCSRRTLQYQFRQRYGCTPMQWLRQRRLERARTRLNNPQPGEGVWQIAQSCGYTNLSSFSRDFRAQHGLTASELLRQRWRSASEDNTASHS
jgi:AraC-like DNA-binding protein